MPSFASDLSTSTTGSGSDLFRSQPIAQFAGARRLMMAPSPVTPRPTPSSSDWPQDLSPIAYSPATRFNALGSYGGLSTMLERGQVIGYDNSRMAFDFTMTDAEGKTVHCKISSTAMDQLEGSKGTIPFGREAQFLRFRDEIERIASSIFDKGVRGPIGFVRIFCHHIG
jgi:hypothetical protein